LGFFPSRFFFRYFCSVEGLPFFARFSFSLFSICANTNWCAVFFSPSSVPSADPTCTTSPPPPSLPWPLLLFLFSLSCTSTGRVFLPGYEGHLISFSSPLASTTFAEPRRSAPFFLLPLSTPRNWRSLFFLLVEDFLSLACFFLGFFPIFPPRMECRVYRLPFSRSHLLSFLTSFFFLCFCELYLSPPFPAHSITVFPPLFGV